MENQKNKVLSIYNLSIAGLFFFLVPSIIGLVYNLSLRGSIKDKALVAHLNKQMMYFILSVAVYVIGFGMINFLDITFINVHLGFVVLVILAILLGFQMKESAAELMFGTKKTDFCLLKTLTHKDPKCIV